jgi:hypothetical protein
MLHVCKFLMICNIQIDASSLEYHDQLPWLPCHWILQNIIYRNTKSFFVPVIVLMAPSRLPLSQNNRTICYLLTFLFSILVKLHSVRTTNITSIQTNVGWVTSAKSTNFEVNFHWFCIKFGFILICLLISYIFITGFIGFHRIFWILISLLRCCGI